MQVYTFINVFLSSILSFYQWHWTSHHKSSIKIINQAKHFAHWTFNILNCNYFIDKYRVPVMTVSALYLCPSSSVSDSSSSQGLSQPSTQTTQYLRADTPNNAAPVTSKSLSLRRRHTRNQTLGPTLNLFSLKTSQLSVTAPPPSLPPRRHPCMCCMTPENLIMAWRMTWWL